MATKVSPKKIGAGDVNPAQLRARPINMPSQLFSLPSKKGREASIRWGGLEDMKMTMASMQDGTLDVIYVRMRELSLAVQTSARVGAPWKDHPDRHRGKGAVKNIEVGQRMRRGKTAHRRWPHVRTAREGLFSFVNRRKTFVELGLSHDRRTVYVKSDGTKYNYGIVLETGFGGTFAIIQPTLQDYHDDVLGICQNALNVRRKAMGSKTTKAGKK